MMLVFPIKEIRKDFFIHSSFLIPHSSFLIPHSSLFRFIELCSINRNSSPLPKTPNLKKTHKIAQNRLFFLDNLSNISI